MDFSFEILLWDPENRQETDGEFSTEIVVSDMCNFFVLDS